jgi:hypothetical protein
MHHASAARAEPSQAAELGSVGPELHLVEGRAAGFLAAQAVQPARPTRTLPPDAALIEEIDQVHATDDRRIAITNSLETCLEPMTDGSRGRTRHLGCFPDVIGAQPLDPLGRKSPVRHGLAAQALDECADILNAPGGGLDTELDRLREAAVFHALHQVDLLTGIGPDGAMIELSRTNPVSGRVL